MSAFGAKRKARKITVQDDDDHNDSTPTATSDSLAFDQGPALQATFKSRPFKQSALRKSINIADDASTDNQPKDSTEDDEDGGAPLLARPSLGARAGSSKIKKRAAPSSRLSFGPSAAATGDDDDAMVLGEEPLPVFTPKKSGLTAAATENSAKKKGITKNARLPLRSMETDEDRPRYSKEYLSELQSSTPNTPANIATLHLEDDADVEMSLDPSELEGATVVETNLVSSAIPESQTAILTEAEVREKKERRARLAKQGGEDDFISLSDDNDGRGAGDSYISVLAKRHPASSTSISQKKEKRLVADDNLDEDDSFFVEDGGLSLGAKAERAARRKKKADIASMIATAEGDDGDDTSDDSEAERRAAYEAAQTRAGMDGLAEEREQQRRRLAGKHGGGVIPVPPKITPLPDLSVLVEEFRARMGRKEVELQRMRARIDELRKEREGIERREPEVQQLLNDAGERYRALMEGGAGDGETAATGGAGGVDAAKSLLERARGTDTPGRGLESLGGSTPVTAPQQREVEMEMG
ncbi:nineteen complex-related protein 2-domain-containing protein [Xylariales sp. PMI_506]|nr:nineteen complex-related protein 2-domain-containing protein [Xylariales sp. PMI_506]